VHAAGATPLDSQTLAWQCQKPDNSGFAQNQTETDLPQKMWNCNNSKWFITFIVCSSRRTAQLCARRIAT